MSKRTSHDMPVFADEDKANEAVEAFFKEVTELRQKHGLHQVWVLVSPLIRKEVEGDPYDVQLAGSLRLGSDDAILPVLASAYGKMRREYGDRLDAAAYGKEAQ